MSQKTYLCSKWYHKYPVRIKRTNEIDNDVDNEKKDEKKKERERKETGERPQEYYKF